MRVEQRQIGGAEGAAGLHQRFTLWIAVAILGAMLSGGHRAEAALQGNVIGVAGADFAIADFDGDSRPDFATVQPGLAAASQTRYWIRFDFSLGKHETFAVSAPTGGLQIASRDVNGDSFLDLIISTRVANEPVAVLLNDGLGNFRLTDAGAFGAGIWETRREWRNGEARWERDGSAMASAGWAATSGGAGVWAELLPTMDEVSIAAEKTDFFVLPHEDRGRAPPAA